jgi:spermidine/putrescine transport system permease protein
MALSRRKGLTLLAPLIAVLIATIVIPAGTFFVYSFFNFELLEAQPAFNLDHYSQALSDETYRKLAENTVKIAIPATVISVVTGFALAYFIALRDGRSRAILLALVVASMLASYLARIYAWRTLLGQEGIVASVIRESGAGDGAPDFLLFSRVGVIIGQVNFLLPFTTLVLFAGLSGIPEQLRSAGRDLGARSSTVFARVTLPLAGPALLAAITFTFFLSAGDYLTPVLLGGREGTTFGTAISDQLRLTGNYPLGAALSFLMIGAFAIVYAAVRLTMRSMGLLPASGVRAGV